MTLSSPSKGRTKANKKSGKPATSTWKQTTTQAGPVCHLTSWSSGRFRAARFSAAHQRVRFPETTMPSSKHNRKAKNPGKPVASRARSKTIIVTVALYGPNGDQATKLVASAVHEPSRDIREMKKWYSDESTDVRTVETVVNELGSFIARWNPKLVVAPEEIFGCPHEEGIDYPTGKNCPKCAYWTGRDRFSGEYIQ